MNVECESEGCITLGFQYQIESLALIIRCAATNKGSSVSLDWWH